MELIFFFGLLCATWLFTDAAEPIYWVKTFFGITNDDQPKQTWKIFLQRLVNCGLCTGFWFALIFYKHILIAALFSVIAEIFVKLMNKYIHKI
jgi:hypothetical protein